MLILNGIKTKEANDTLQRGVCGLKGIGWYLLQACSNGFVCVILV